jgi:hypothetical protein
MTLLYDTEKQDMYKDGYSMEMGISCHVIGGHRHDNSLSSGDYGDSKGSLTLSTTVTEIWHSSSVA